MPIRLWKIRTGSRLRRQRVKHRLRKQRMMHGPRLQKTEMRYRLMLPKQRLIHRLRPPEAHLTCPFSSGMHKAVSLLFMQLRQRRSTRDTA